MLEDAFRRAVLEMNASNDRGIVHKDVEERESIRELRLPVMN